MTAKRAPLALLVEVREEYGTREVAATPVYLGDGGLRNPVFEWSGRYNDVANLDISAFVDTGPNPCAGGAPYGYGVRFTPYRVELDQAEAIVKTLRRVARSLEAMDTERGYVRDGDFLTYLTRVAEILAVKHYYVRNTERLWELTGERWRRLGGGGLQHWLADAAANGFPVSHPWRG